MAIFLYWLMSPKYFVSNWVYLSCLAIILTLLSDSRRFTTPESYSYWDLRLSTENTSRSSRHLVT